MKKALGQVVTYTLLGFLWIFAKAYELGAAFYRHKKWQRNPNIGDFCVYKCHYLRNDPVYRGKMVGVIISRLGKKKVLVRCLLPEMGQNSCQTRHLKYVSSKDFDRIKERHAVARLGLGLKNRGMTC